MRFKLDSSAKCTGCKCKECKTSMLHLLVAPSLNASFKKNCNDFSVATSHKYHVLIHVLLNRRLMRLTPFLCLIYVYLGFLSVVDAVQPLLRICDFPQHLQRQNPNPCGVGGEWARGDASWCYSTSTMVVNKQCVRQQAKCFAAQVSLLPASTVQWVKMPGMLCFFCISPSFKHGINQGFYQSKN